MILFLIMTPAQLMNAIVLKQTVFKEEDGDAYITENLEKFRKRVEDERVFREIYPYALVSDLLGRDNAVKRSIVRVKNAMDLKKIRRSLPSDPALYSKVFASGISLRNYEIYYAIRSVNPEVKISLYEEGLCEYYYLAEKSKSKAFFSHFFFHAYYPEECRELYVYSPETVENRWDNITVKKIPKFVYDPFLLDLLNRVFFVDPEETKLFRDKVIFLESCYDDKEMEQFQLSMLEELVGKMGAENVVVKMHPRSLPDKYPSHIRNMYSSVPFEMIAANTDLDNSAFVSVSSSALINPKLMLGKEPAVICLDRLKKKELRESDRVFDRVLSSYENGSFFLPESHEQFGEAIDLIKQKIGLNRGTSSGD